MTNEPVLTLGGAVLAVFVAGIALLPTFGIDITGEQQAALIAFVTAVITLVTVVQRSRVTPVSNAQDKIDTAYQARAGIDPKPTV